MERRMDDAPATSQSSYASGWYLDPNRLFHKFAGPEPFVELGNTLCEWLELNTPDIMM